MFFDILRFYLLLLYSTCQILSATYFNSAAYHFRQQSWLSVCQASRVEMLLVVEVRNWEEEEQEAIEGEIYHNNELVSN